MSHIMGELMTSCKDLLNKYSRDPAAVSVRGLFADKSVRATLDLRCLNDFHPTGMHVRKWVALVFLLGASLALAHAQAPSTPQS
ncbi:MAG: hypothetical protein WAN38_05865, partial [Terriglobales bacterium]